MPHERQRYSKKNHRRSQANKDSQAGGRTPARSDSDRDPVSGSNSHVPVVSEPCNEHSSLGETVQSSVDSLASLLNAAQNDTPRATAASSVAPSTPSSLLDDDRGWSKAVESKLQELIDQSRSNERERFEIEQLREQLRQAIETAESRLVAANSDEGLARLEELEIHLIETQRENAQLSTLLLNTRNEYQSLMEFIESESSQTAQKDEEECARHQLVQDLLEKAQAREKELNLEISQLLEQIQFLQGEIKEFNELPHQANNADSELRIQIEHLRSQLLEARHEAVELRMQNNELGSRLAKFQGPAEAQRIETLTWEQRKEALLQQLEAETRMETPCDPHRVLEIERIIDQTNSEIERRDREIADLRSLLEQQSIAQDGMAIGVAAVAEMIESDDLIVAERLRLKELQAEWEQKQRQAEIEMSLERAKLARERLELQEKLRNIEPTDSGAPEEVNNKLSKEKTRGRWWARLGLRDE